MGENRMSYVAHSSRVVKRKEGMGPVRMSGNYFREPGTFAAIRCVTTGRQGHTRVIYFRCMGICK